MAFVEEQCEICGLTSAEAPLHDAVVGREVAKVCRVCAHTTDVILINKPTKEQIQEAEKPFTVFQRLRRAARLRMNEEEMRSRSAERKREQQINLSKLAARGGSGSLTPLAPSARNIHTSPASDSPQKEYAQKPMPALVSNFAELIRNARSSKGISQRQLAEAIAESEQEIMFLEAGRIPNNEKLVRKLEQFLRITIVKKEDAEKKLNFKSPTLTIADVRRMKEEMFRGITEKEEEAASPEAASQEAHKEQSAAEPVPAFEASAESPPQTEAEQKPKKESELLDDLNKF